MSAPLTRSSAPNPLIRSIFRGEDPVGTTTTLRTPIREAA
jgi:hypothetical protein